MKDLQRENREIWLKERKAYKIAHKYVAGIISELMARKQHSQGTRRGDTQGKPRMKGENTKLQENIKEGHIN